MSKQDDEHILHYSSSSARRSSSYGYTFNIRNVLATYYQVRSRASTAISQMIEEQHADGNNKQQ